MNRAEPKVSECEMLLLAKQPWGCFMTHDGELRTLSLRDRVLLERVQPDPTVSVSHIPRFQPLATGSQRQVAAQSFGSSDAERLRGWFIWAGHLPEQIDAASKILENDTTLGEAMTQPCDAIVHVVGRGRVDEPEDCGSESGAALHQHIFQCAAALPQGESTMLRVNARVDMGYIHRHMQAWISRWLGLPDDSALLLLHRRETFRQK